MTRSPLITHVYTSLVPVRIPAIAAVASVVPYIYESFRICVSNNTRVTFAFIKAAAALTV